MIKFTFLGVFCLCTAHLVVGKAYFKEYFSDESWEDRWVQSSWKSDLGKFVWSSGKEWKVDAEIEKGIQVQQDAKFYAISAKLDEPFSNEGEDLVVQFTVKNEGKEGSFCGGGYIKLLPADTDQSKFGGNSDYFIMFGPDLCGYDTSRIHVIFNYDGQNLEKEAEIKLDYSDKNDKTHLYTLVVKSDNTYEVYFDQNMKASGILQEDWAFPKKMIPDESDVKPSDWQDEEYIPDPEAVKPDDFDDEPKMIPDSDAKKPDDWDDEDDGEWEPPMVSNPKYKGEWKPPMIKNEAYQGEWKQKMLPNENYVENVYAYSNIGVVGFELWIVNSGSIFDNIYVGNSYDEALDMAEKTWGVIQPKEDDAKKEWEDAHKDKEDDKDEEEEDAEEEDEQKEDL